MKHTYLFLILLLQIQVAHGGISLNTFVAELIPDCERALLLKSIDQMQAKKFTQDGFVLLSQVRAPSDKKIAELFRIATEADLDSFFDPEAENVINKSYERRFYLDPLIEADRLSMNMSLVEVNSRASQGIVIDYKMSSILQNYLSDIHSESQRATGLELELVSVELRALSDRAAQKNDDKIWYHVDNAEIRFTASLLGPSTYVRDGEDIYSAPSKIPLLFTGQYIKNEVPNVPVTLHGHPRTKERRLILVGTFKIKRRRSLN